MAKKRIILRLNSNDTCVEIQFPLGEKILIDRKDLELFSKHAWYIDRSKKGQTFYLVRNGLNRTVGFHLDLMSVPKGLEVDHINGNGLDNRRSNLRIVTHKQNQQNQRKRRDARGKFHGVFWSSRDASWQAQARINGKRKTICRHKNERTAAIIRENWIIQNESDSKRNFL